MANADPRGLGRLTAADEVRPLSLLVELDDEARHLLDRSAQLLQVGAGKVVMQPGDPCHQIPFVLTGELRVHRTSASGRDLTLYRILPGESCSLTALRILSGLPFSAHVTTSEDTTLLSVPSRVFTQLYDDQPAWRGYFLRLLSYRVGDLMELIDGVLFTDLPTRLADVLLTRQESGVVRATHEQLAAEIGSSREVVSRALKAWERQGTVALSRGQVAIVSPQALARQLV